MIMLLYLGDERSFVLIVREKYHQEKVLRKLSISVQLTMATGFTAQLLISFLPAAKKKNQHFKKLLPKV